MRWFIALACGATSVLVACTHTPPPGVMRGVLKITNTQMTSDGSDVQGALSGVAVSDSVVLTAGHTFIYEPESDHPLEIQDLPVTYEVLADGLAGKRIEADLLDRKADLENLGEDYLFIRTNMQRAYTPFVPLKKERLGDVREATFVSTTKAWGERAAVPLKEFVAINDGAYIFFEFEDPSMIDRYWISGSPLFGTYPDGTLVLIGIATATGDLTQRIDGRDRRYEDVVMITPAYEMPWDEITD